MLVSVSAGPPSMSSNRGFSSQDEVEQTSELSLHLPYVWLEADLSRREKRSCQGTARTKGGVTKGVACRGSVSRGLAGLIFFSVNHIQKLDVRDRCRKQEGDTEWRSLVQDQLLLVT